MKHIRIISLGEIVVQVQAKILIELAKLINSANPKAVMGQLAAILQNPETQRDLEQFRLGFKSEEALDNEMLSKIKQNTGCELTPDQFNAAWDAMNPSFPEFASLLSEVVDARRADLQVVLVSNTNRKDMRHLMSQLDTHSIPYTRDSLTEEINSICGVPLYLTYATQKSKAELILQVIEQQKTVGTSTPFGSFFEQKSSADGFDVKYVRCVRSAEDPIYKLLSDKSNSEVAKTTSSNEVETILWDIENKQPLSDVIYGRTFSRVPVAKL